MIFPPRDRVYNVYEKPEAADPADRMILVREGFFWWAFWFGALWLGFKRMWLVLLIFIAASIALSAASHMVDLPKASDMMMQLWLQVMLAYHAGDLQGWTLKRRGYRLAGVLVAPTSMRAEQRYFQHAA
jgi:hypothetical protein